MFELRNLQKSLKRPKNQKLAIVASSIATLVASGSTSQVVDDDNDNDTSLNKAVVVKPVLSLATPLVTSNADFQINSHTNGYQRDQGVAGLKNGGFVSVWETTDSSQDGDSSAIKARIFNADGTQQSDEFLVNSQTNFKQVDASVAALNNGGFVIGWMTFDEEQDGSGYALKAQFYNPDGSSNGSEILVNTEYASNQRHMVITSLENGNVVFTWYGFADNDNNGAVKARIFNQNGQPLDVEFLVNTETVGQQDMPSIAALSDGNFIIVWETNDPLQDGEFSAIKGQLFTADGTKIGAEMLINFYTDSTQRDPSVAALTNGKFIVTWTSANPDNNIQVRVFDNDGTPFGNESTINIETDGSQRLPKITALAGGGFVIVWETDDTNQDGNESAIKAQIFNADFFTQGGEILINNHTTGFQDEPEIAALTNGGFVVNWVSSDSFEDESFESIVAQIFNYTPVYKYTKANVHNFDITAELHDFQTDATLSDITITGIPNGITFNNGVLDGDTLTLTQADLDGLEMTLGVAGIGQIEFTISVTSTDNGQDGKVITTTLYVPISIGNPILTTENDDAINATAETDHIDGLDGIDTVTFSGNKAEYSFAIAGNDIQVTHIQDGTTNVDLLHSVEYLDFADLADSFSVYKLDNLGDLPPLTNDWLQYNYEYS